jgi:hypothetical protein
MLNIKAIDNEMFYYCVQCNTTEKSSDSTVYHQNYDNLLKYTNSNQLKNIIYDNTLSRTVKYICPNPKCTSNSLSPPKTESVFWRDQIDLSMILVCTQCATMWKGMD